MPILGVAAYAFLRQVVMAVASGAVVTFAQELLDGTFKQLVYEIRDTEGVTEQDAKDIVANVLADFALNSASILAVLKTGAGVKVAEWLGLTSRKYGKTALTPVAEKAVTKMSAEGGVGIAKKLFPTVIKIIGIPATLIWLTSSLANIIEPGIYKPEQTNALYRKLGIPFQYPVALKETAPGPFSSDGSVTFSDFYKSVVSAGVTGVNNPVAQQSQLLTYENLADVVNYVYGQEILKGNNLKVANLLPLLRSYLIGGNLSTTLPSPATSVTTSPAIPKVYTGIVSQGVIGKGLSFTPRPDDLIESVEELRQAAANNLAPFLETILGKIIYEVKIVPSIITKDGFKQTGTVQQIRSGTTATGAPKYKTVVNKFATLNLYVMTDKGVRSKISTIVLGPTNSAKLTVGINDIKEVETSLPKLVTTNNINDITGIETAQSVTVSTPVASGGASVPALDTGTVVTSATPVSSQGLVTAVPGNTALTLSDWYRARGLPLPSVSERAVIYAELGLGQASFYTGTAEQNSKLLSSLKQTAGVYQKPEPEPVQTVSAPRTGNTVALKDAKVGDPKRFSGGKVTERWTQEEIDNRDKPVAKKVKSIVTTTDGYRVTTYTDDTKDRVLIKK